MDFNTALTNMIARMNAHMVNYYNTESNFADCTQEWIDRSTYITKAGTKFVKIVREGSVVAFIEKATGNIFKPASWQAPAKGIRGNIFSEKNGDEALQYDMCGLVFVKYAR